MDFEGIDQGGQGGVEQIDQQLVKMGVPPELLRRLGIGGAPANTNTGPRPNIPRFTGPRQEVPAPEIQANPTQSAMTSTAAPQFTNAQPKPPVQTGGFPTPAAPSFTQRFQDAQASEPTRQQFQPQPMSMGQKILAGVKTGAFGALSPAAGVVEGEKQFGAPKRQAEQDFTQAHQTWADKTNAIGKEAAIADTESQTRERDALAQKALNPPAAKPDRSLSPEADLYYTLRDQGVAPEEAARRASAAAAKPEKPVADSNKLAAEIEAQVGPKPVADPQNPNAPVQWNGKTYRSVAAAQAAWGQAAERIKNNEAAAGADARGKAFGANRPINVLDTWNGNRPVVVSAKDAEENPSRYVTQAGGTKALGQGVTIDDIQGALENLKSKTKVLDKGGSVNRAAIAAVLADPKSTAANFLQSEVAGQLNADEQDYVIALLTAREVVPGIRTLLGTGAATDSRVKNMLDTLPGAKTPDSVYANKQIDSILATLKRVRPAVPNVKAQGSGAPENKPTSNFREF
jgi:hypothetical protein